MNAQERIATTLEGLLRLQEGVAQARMRERREEVEREQLGRGYQSVPRRIGADLALRGVPGFAGLFERAVPADFWSLDGGTAIIACPCGEHEPRVAVNAVATCECERAYLYTGDTVRVAFSPANRPTPVQS